ncbi:uncharacterized protein LY89DRAFT_13449 [Mollisia scopiformis]|uniref:Uncharacterized protein n=1 Tax=Mollisia scopiformis TaxID=149040 RepID=A0A194XVA5_MOLSC|nr:uncharacterized protein LY89DRAFT_13449 [Mollisia scopiformis]KUJ24143.1 hypothetical protein LY89DRAFT_13449 [Mollisia scopiformis]
MQLSPLMWHGAEPEPELNSLSPRPRPRPRPRPTTHDLHDDDEAPPAVSMVRRCSE